jgi:hypothetical protein
LSVAHARSRAQAAAAADQVTAALGQSELHRRAGGPARPGLRSGIREAAQTQVSSIQALRPEDIADAVAYIVTRDRRVAVNEMLVRAGEQTW